MLLKGLNVPLANCNLYAAKSSILVGGQSR
jgi:hypothetical protein